MAARRQSVPRPQKRRPKQQVLKVEEFAIMQGMNAQEERSAIPKGFWSWLMNMQPVGQRTLRVLNGKGSDIYTLGGDTITNGIIGLIGSTYYAFLFTAAGAAYQVNLATGAHVTIGTANTFWTGSGQYPHASNFGNSGIVIVSPVGYWAWDGTTLFSAGNQAPTWLSGLTNNSITISGTATNGSPNITNITTTAGLIVGMACNLTGFSAGFASPSYIGIVVSATQLTIHRAGIASNFTGVTGTYNFTFNPLDLVVQATNNTNTITAVSETGGSLAALSIGMGIFTGVGFASGTTVTALISATSVVVSKNYTPSTGYVELIFGWPMPTGIVGTAIEIYNASPWIVNGRTILASAPGNGADFATSDGGVSLTVKDDYVQDGYSGLKQLDGFLYLFGHGCVDVISDVQTTGSPPTTTFLRINVSSLIGTPWRDSIAALPSSINCANTTGIFEVAGAQLRKVSDPVDGIFAEATYPVAATDPSGFHPSAAVLTLNETICYALTVSIPDPDDTTQTFVPSIVVWDGRRWFLGSQESNIDILLRQDNDSVLVGWASQGTKLFQCFKTPSSSVSLIKKAKSWFSVGDAGSTMRKQVKRVYAQFGNNAAGTPLSEFNIDTEIGSFATPPISPGIVTWLNKNSQIVVWQNNSAQVVTWTTSFYPLIIGGAANVIALMFGVTIESVETTLDIVGLQLGYVDYSRYE